ncbi:MAG: hypothetical protein HYX78_15615 [Armatimonadetes bacterium]|nr:hypothetical protein [Armatimonadota bacterium]
MVRLVITLWLIILLSVPLSAQRQQIGTVEVTGYSSITLTKENEITFAGPRVYMRTSDGSFEAKAAKMVIRLGLVRGEPGAGSLRSATLAGDVWLLTRPEPGKSTEARSERAEIDRADTRQAVLTGNVRIESTDPSAFAGPLKVNADKAIVSLKPSAELKAGEARLRIESDPGKSRLEFTPVPPSSEQ